MDSQDKIQDLQTKINVIKGEIEGAREKAETFEKLCLTAKNSFVCLEGRSLDSTVAPAQVTGESSKTFPPENNHLVVNVETGKVNYLQRNIKLGKMLIKCERSIKERLKILYQETVDGCELLLGILSHDVDERSTELLPEHNHLLTQRENQPSENCSQRSTTPKLQRPVQRFQNQLRIVKRWLNNERHETEHYKQLIQNFVAEIEEMLNRMEQQQSSFICDPLYVSPVQHTVECRTDFTCEDQEIVEKLKILLTQIEDNMVKIEQEEEEGTEAVIEAITQEAAVTKTAQQSHCPGLSLPCEERRAGPPESKEMIHQLQLKLEMLEIQLKSERERAELSEQLYLTASETPADEPPQQEHESPSGWFSSKLVKGVCVAVAAVAGVGLLTLGLRYFR